MRRRGFGLSRCVIAIDHVVLENSPAQTSHVRRGNLRNLPPRGPVRWGLCGLLCGALIALGWEAGYVLLGPNFHCVAPAMAYRSAQPKAAWLDRTIHQHGIRSVINLRGDGHESAWYVNERAVAKEHGAYFENVMLSAAFAPNQRDLRRLVRVFDSAPRPVLFHCRSGGDRSGLAAAIFLLLCTDAPVEEARGQLSLRYGHNPYGRSACLHGVLDRYEEWLATAALEHRPEHLRHWIMRVYRRPA